MTEDKSTIGACRLAFFLQHRKIPCTTKLKTKLAATMSQSVQSQWPGGQDGCDKLWAEAETKTSVKVCAAA